MRKFIAIVFLLIYVQVGLGTAINFHFCGKQLSQVSIDKIDSKSFCGCKTKGPVKDCCKDVCVLVKSDNHQAQASVDLPQSGFKLLASASLIPQDQKLYCLQKKEINYSFSRPRGYLIKDIFLTVRNLRI